MTAGHSRSVVPPGLPLQGQDPPSTLVPLQIAGPDSLDPQGLHPIARIVLR